MRACYCGRVRKRRRAKRKTRTFFEQIPLETVKKVSNLVHEPPSTKTEPYSLESVWLPHRAPRDR
jgi:hypothetical protein